MKKLIESYKKLPSPANRTKLQNYINKHMMAICMASPEDISFLKSNEFKV